MVIHWETIVTKVHSQMLMAMKSGQMLMAMKSGCKILHVTVKDVATLFVPHLSNLPPVALDPAYMYSTMSKSCQFFGTNHDKILTAFMELYLFV